MDKLDSELLQFIRQNAQMGTVTLTRLGEMLEAGYMKDTVTKQLAEYDAVFSEAGAKLEAGREEAKDVSHVVQAAATAMLGMQSPTVRPRTSRRSSSSAPRAASYRSYAAYATAAAPRPTRSTSHTACSSSNRTT